MADYGNGQFVPPHWNMCPACGKPRPKDTDELDELIIQIWGKESFESNKRGWGVMKEELLAWKDKAVKEAMGKHKTDKLGSFYTGYGGTLSAMSNPMPAISDSITTQSNISKSLASSGSEPESKLADVIRDNYRSMKSVADWKDIAEAVKDFLKERMPGFKCQPGEMISVDFSGGWDSYRAEMLRLLEEV